MNKLEAVLLVIVGALLILGPDLLPVTRAIPPTLRLTAWTLGTLLVLLGTTTYALRIVSDMTEESQLYVRKMAPYWGRGMSLLLLLGTLIYFSFFFQIAVVTEDSRKELAASETWGELYFNTLEKVGLQLATAW